MSSEHAGQSEAEGLPPSVLRRQFAAEALVRQLDAINKRVEGVRSADDVQMVHKMRVATRRLRNAMHLFADAMPTGRREKWLKRIKRVTRALGRARDTDVQILTVERFLEQEEAGEHRANAAGVQRLLLRLRQRRQKLQPGVAKAMDRLESSGVIDTMRQQLLEMRVEARMTAMDATSEPTPVHAGDPLLHDARQIVALRLEQMLAYERYVHDAQFIDELHQMRIASKYLRYTLEAYGPLFADGLRWQTKLVRQVQELLGDIHDCDVWAQQLPDFIERERRRHAEFHGHLRGFRKIEAGVGDFMHDRAELRRQLHRRFVRLWDEAAEGGRWAALRDSLCVGAAAEAAPDASLAGASAAAADIDP